MPADYLILYCTFLSTQYDCSAYAIPEWRYKIFFSDWPVMLPAKWHFTISLWIFRIGNICNWRNQFCCTIFYKRYALISDTHRIKSKYIAWWLWSWIGFSHVPNIFRSNMQILSKQIHRRNGCHRDDYSKKRFVFIPCGNKILIVVLHLLLSFRRILLSFFGFIIRWACA